MSRSINWILLSLAITCCEPSPGSEEPARQGVVLSLHEVAPDPCDDCTTLSMDSVHGTSSVAVHPPTSLSIRISRENVQAISVSEATGETEWKAWIRLDDATLGEVRKFAAEKPGAQRFLASVQDRGLSVIRDSAMARRIVVGSFSSKDELEEALGLRGLLVHTVAGELDRTLEEESSALIGTADAALEDHEHAGRILDQVHEALQRGDEEEAQRLMELLKKDSPDP